MNYQSAPDKATKLAILTKLRNLGDYLHNQNVLKAGSGKLSVVYRQRQPANHSDYVPCTHCYGTFKKSDLWKHVSRCPLNSSPKKSKRNRHVAKGKLLKPIKGASKQFANVLSTLKDDLVTYRIKRDPLLRRLGEQLTVKHGHDYQQFPYIRNVLRDLSKLLIASGMERMEQIIDPAQFRRCISTVKSMAGYDSETNKFEIPSLPLRISSALQKCTSLLKTEAMERYEDEQRKRAKCFGKLIEERWTIELASNAHRTLQESKRNKVKLLPPTADVQKLSLHLKNQMQKNISTLQKNNDNYTAFSQLSQQTLALIILFNKRRSGEVGRMLLADYYGANTTTATMDEDLGFSSLERALSDSLRRVEIRGKRGQNVPMLLTELMVESIELLISCRPTVGIPESNKYIFPNSSLHGCLRGHDCLRKFAEECQAQNPESLR